jgi:serine phosphatase RsbU (regulator of sigma subunit)
MDIALVVLDEPNRKLYFAGAYNSMYIFRGQELFELKADRMPIGIYIKEKESFTLTEFDYKPGDTFYIFSDGYADKFRYKALQELFASIQPKSMEEQKEILNQTIIDWMGDLSQIDDQVIIGIRLK